MGVSAYVLLGWCRAAEGGGALCHYPPGEARSGAALLRRGRFAPGAPYVHRQVPNSRGEGGPPFPAGQSPVWAGAPRVWALRPVCCSAGAEQ